MTSVGYIIQPGKSIPDDVTQVDDADGDVWRPDKEPDRWMCTGSTLRDRPSVWVSTQYGPLTVTAVREPEPTLSERNHAAFIAEGCCGMVAVHMADCPQFDAAKLRAAVYTYAPEPQQADVPPLLDLVRQYGDERVQSVVGGLGDEAAEHAAAAKALLDRIAALDLRARSQAQQLQADLDTVKADRETIKGALEIVKDRVTRPAIKLLGVQHNEDIVPAIERLKAAQPDPLVLSLREVPEGAVALIGNATGRRYTRYLKTDSWCDGEGAILPFGSLLVAEDGSVTVEMAPPREPRRWPKLDGEPDLPRRIEVVGQGLYEREAGTRLYIHERDGGSTWSLQELRELGEVREVFDA